MRVLRPTFNALRALGLGALTLALAVGFGVGSASADPIFYLVPTGPTTVPTVVPVGTSTYQLWVDPSSVTAPNCLTPINGGCTGIYSVENLQFLAEGSLTMTAFTSNTSAPAFTDPSTQLQQPYCVSFSMVGPGYCYSSFLSFFSTGDTLHGNATPFLVGTMTITNNGSGAGDVFFGPPIFNFTGVVPEYFDANAISALYFSANQTLAVAAPEPGTLLLLGAGLGGLAAAVRARRPHDVTRARATPR